METDQQHTEHSSTQTANPLSSIQYKKSMCLFVCVCVSTGNTVH